MNGYTPSYSNCGPSLAVTSGNTTICTITNTFNGYTTTTATQVSTTSFTIGASVSDTATVTGHADAAADPSGNVDFYLCGPSNPAAAYVACDSSGTKVTDNASLTGDGNALTFTATASSGSITPTKAGKYCMYAEYEGETVYKSSNDNGLTNECFVVNPAASTVVYTGQFDDANGPPTTLSATVTSSYQACAANRQVKFELDGAVTDYLGGAAKTATTGATTTGSYTGSASTNQNLAFDVYDLTASVAAKDLGSDGIPECSPGSDPADLILTVAEPGSDAHGGGWYKVDGASPPRVNFGFTVKKQRDDSYKGQILWMNNSEWKLKGTLDGYAAIPCPATGGPYERCGMVTGTGTLYEWNGTDWVNPQSVSFTARFYDGGQTSCAKKNCTKQERPDWFGMQIHLLAIDPESNPLQLWGGSIKAGA